MLWYKGWLETRFKLLASTVIILFVLNNERLILPVGGRVIALGPVLFMNTIAVGMACIWLAGAGIVTQPSFQATKGIHGSTLFTLSLPVSRLRLVSVRAALGWLLLAGSIVFLCCAAWVLIPAMRVLATPREMLEYGGTLLAGASAFYFLCVLLATFLEETWRIFGAMIVFGVFRWISKHTTLPAFTDIYRAMGDGSPLMLHAVPWVPIAFAIGLSVVLFLGALKIAQVREY